MLIGAPFKEFLIHISSACKYGFSDQRGLAEKAMLRNNHLDMGKLCKLSEWILHASLQEKAGGQSQREGSVTAPILPEAEMGIVQTPIRKLPDSKVWWSCQCVSFNPVIMTLDFWPYTSENIDSSGLKPSSLG
jgi:hypothetical protein